jgi:hypothetical protein
MKHLWRFRFQQTFFGLSDQYQESVYEQFFYLKYYGGFSLFESYNLPVPLRKWFVEKLIDQLKEESDAVKNASRK